LAPPPAAAASGEAAGGTTGGDSSTGAIRMRGAESSGDADEADGSTWLGSPDAGALARVAAAAAPDRSGSLDGGAGAGRAAWTLLAGSSLPFAGCEGAPPRVASHRTPPSTKTPPAAPTAAQCSGDVIMRAGNERRFLVADSAGTEPSAAAGTAAGALEAAAAARAAGSTAMKVCVFSLERAAGTEGRAATRGARS
jgi:hypothetical protein